MESIDNLFQLAAQAESVKNYREAYDYYKRILEINPANVKALIGKGLAAGWLTTLAKPRIRESLETVLLALKKGCDADLEAYREWIGSNFNAIALSLYAKMVDTYAKKEYGDLNYSPAFFSHLSDVLDLLRTALLLNPKETYANNIVGIYKTMTSSISALLELRTQTRVAVTLQKALDAAENFLKKNNPSYITVEEQNKQAQKELEEKKRANMEQASQASKKEGCFIATAIYGDYSAPEVLVLREFRDNVLKENLIGNYLIKLYYRISPPLAEWLKHRQFIKRIIKTCLDALVRTLRG